MEGILGKLVDHLAIKMLEYWAPQILTAIGTFFSERWKLAMLVAAGLFAVGTVAYRRRRRIA